MADPFIGEIRAFSFSFAPRGWALCNGQLMAIQQNQALFALLGTIYGGDGRTNFGLPNLQGRVPIHVSPARPQGAVGGEISHTLIPQEIPFHTHGVMASPNLGTQNIPANDRVLSRRTAEIYHAPTDLVPMSPAMLAPSGSAQAHNNLQPYLVLNFCIAIVGIFPSRN